VRDNAQIRGSNNLVWSNGGMKTGREQLKKLWENLPQWHVDHRESQMMTWELNPSLQCLK
jgi:hypothetical protein